MKQFVFLSRLRYFILVLLVPLMGLACSPGEVTPPATTVADAVAVGETREADVVPTAIRTPLAETARPTYITPPQQEGPYYPVEKPAEQDNDLVSTDGSTVRPTGEILHLSGIVYDESGSPIEGATVEIWQTDSNGIYLHPGDPDTAQRDPHFQFYGESRTSADGVYSFRTILPGRYEPRPRHIHVKVRLDGDVILTTQFYFATDIALRGAQAHLLVDMAPAEDDAGRPIWVGERDIVLHIP